MPGLDFSTIKQSRVVLTDSQIKQLPVTGMAVAPAPGASKVVLPVGIFFSLVNPTNQMYVGSAKWIGLWLGTPTDPYAPTGTGMLMLNLIDLTAVTNAIGGGQFTTGMNWFGTISGGPAALYLNKPLLVIAAPDDNSWPNAALTGGASGNTLTVTTYYVNVDI